MSEVLLVRKENFSASHRLHSEKLSDAENQKLFGKCNSKNGHGHNYTLEVTLKGPLDERTGLLFNLTDLKQAIEKAVLSKVDHCHLNLDLPEFSKLNPTSENLAVVIWSWLEKELPPDLLYEVKVQETQKNIAIFRGER